MDEVEAILIFNFSSGLLTLNNPAIQLHVAPGERSKIVVPSMPSVGLVSTGRDEWWPSQCLSVSVVSPL